MLHWEQMLRRRVRWSGGGMNCRNTCNISFLFQSQLQIKKMLSFEQHTKRLYTNDVQTQVVQIHVLYVVNIF